MADANGFMVFAPEFSDANFPTGDKYQLGNIFDDGDNPSLATYNPKNEWTFSIIDPLFEYIKADVSGTQQAYNAWGHSGGAQFLHRFVEYLPNSKLDIAVCSNSGWYAVPEFTVDFPYGLNEGQLSNATLTTAFAKKLIMHLGLDDVDPNSAGLRHNTVVDDQQGLYRLERGRYFYSTSQTTSQSMLVPFNWEKHEASGIAHDPQGMANDALPYILQSTLNADNFTSKETLKIYPNPAHDVFNFNNLKTQFKSIDIYHVGGVLIQQFEIEDFKADQLINISMLQSGIYFLSLKNETNIVFERIIKFYKKRMPHCTHPFFILVS